ncbi:pantoate--beta-alanine ligase [Novosphingobium aquimarinum]|uniref:pantoate--beta-alanine ligase n=1 Tax=Novosphingobium aquimarinum TaxID=2682494 RepID=UPI0012ECB60B|nr:pantoate--beta-alanine ligase [Novosphingobium aquimarinum]
MQIVQELDPLRTAVAGLRRTGTLALVPTMGALHQGHLELVRTARERADTVAVSIFVNPRQFGAGEDLDAYPRQFERDCAMLEAEGVDLVWAPGVDQMYPPGYATNISVSGVSEGLCGGTRPGHFDGVATVVCKLFNQVRPDLAFFGEKDWQQLAVIRRMARDLDLVRPAADRILGVPTVREADGLAMSSRNAYLTESERAQAATLPAAMRAATAAIVAGTPIDDALDTLRRELVRGGFSAVDYAEVRDAASLEPIERLAERPARLLVAARIGRARLIDNMPLVVDPRTAPPHPAA